MKVGPYEVLRKLGEGAYGKVYLARKRSRAGFVTWYALKRIARTRERGQRFEDYLHREAQVGGLVNHPGLVRVHEVLDFPREWVLVQDFVDGVTLGRVLADHQERGEAVPREVALELVAELLETLHYLHTLRDPEGRASGFVHRDVKPGNVMLTAGHGIRVMDFGVARGEEGLEGTLAGELRGTLAYMAPEQATGEPVGPAADQFAAALVLLEMLIGGSPWGDVRGAAVLGKVVTGDVTAGLAQLEVDDPVGPIVRRMLSRSAADRYPTAVDAADALRSLRARTPTPPALRRFSRTVVEALRTDLPEEDEHPSWTGAWTAAAPDMPRAREVDSLGPVEEPAEDDAAPPRTSEERLDADQDDILDRLMARDDAAEEPASDAVAAAAASDEDPAEDVLDLDEDDPDGLGPAGPDAEELDIHGTLPLETTPAQRAALLASLGLNEQADGSVRLGTGETLEAVQARLEGVDANATLPLPRGATLPLVEAPSDAPVPEPTPEPPLDPTASAPTLAALPAREGEPALAGGFAGPAEAPVLPPQRRKRTKKADSDRVNEVHPTLLQQFVKSPVLGTVVLLVLLLLVAAGVRLAWIAVRPAPEQLLAEEDLDQDDLLLPSERARRERAERVTPMGSAVAEETPAPGGRVEPEAAPLAEEAVVPAEEEAELASLDDAPAQPDGDPDPSSAAAAPAPRVAPARAGGDAVLAAGEDLDADLASWRGESAEPTPAPAPRGPRPGEIVSGSGAGERLLDEADGERNIATRRGATEDAEPTPAPTPAEARLRFLSSGEQPLGAPLSVRVRSDGFYATDVVVYYQWRSEGAAARKRRSLRQQPDGSFELEIPASELQRDRLQLWFVSEPGSVALGSAGSPLEVRVR